MGKQTMNCAFIIATIGAVTLGANAPSWAAPVPAGTAGIKAAAPSAVSDVRYRGYRGRYYRGAGAAVGLGLLGAAAGAAAYGSGYGYAPDYYAGPGYYGPGFYGADRVPRQGIDYYGFDRRSGSYGR
jgi:transposase